jgi:hypothetical protein
VKTGAGHERRKIDQLERALRHGEDHLRRTHRLLSVRRIEAETKAGIMPLFTESRSGTATACTAMAAFTFGIADCSPKPDIRFACCWRITTGSVPGRGLPSRLLFPILLVFVFVPAIIAEALFGEITAVKKSGIHRKRPLDRSAILAYSTSEFPDFLL